MQIRRKVFLVGEQHIQRLRDMKDNVRSRDLQVGSSASPERRAKQEVETDMSVLVGEGQITTHLGNHGKEVFSRAKRERERWKRIMVKNTLCMMPRGLYPPSKAPSSHSKNLSILPPIPAILTWP